MRVVWIGCTSIRRIGWPGNSCSVCYWKSSPSSSVEVVFLTSPNSDVSPESNLLLQMQGMIAEYERAKILEPTRRGRRFNGKSGRERAGVTPPLRRFATLRAIKAMVRLVMKSWRTQFARCGTALLGRLEGLKSPSAVTRRLSSTYQHERDWELGDIATLRGILVNPGLPR